MIIEDRMTAYPRLDEMTACQITRPILNYDDFLLQLHTNDIWNWHKITWLRKTICANKSCYLKNERVAQLGFPTKPSCANVKFYLWMSMRTLLLVSIDWPIWSEFSTDISVEWAELGLSQSWQLTSQYKREGYAREDNSLLVIMSLIIYSRDGVFTDDHWSGCIWDI